MTVSPGSSSTRVERHDHHLHVVANELVIDFVALHGCLLVCHTGVDVERRSNAPIEYASTVLFEILRILVHRIP